MAEHASSASAQPSQGVVFSETTWDQINEPGASVERGTGDLHRVAHEATGPASPMIKKQSLGASRLVKLSGNPFLRTLEARMLCAVANIHPNF